MIIHINNHDDAGAGDGGGSGGGDGGGDDDNRAAKSPFFRAFFFSGRDSFHMSAHKSTRTCLCTRAHVSALYACMHACTRTCLHACQRTGPLGSAEATIVVTQDRRTAAPC